MTDTTHRETDSSAPADRSVNMGEVYDTFAGKFAEADKLPTWQYVGKDAMRRVLDPVLRTGMRFLDFGAASGRVEAGVLIPAGVLPEDITGVEISPDQVAIARQRISGAEFLVGDIADPLLLSDRAGAYDVVFSHMVFEHLSDEQLAAACANAYRLLKFGGVFAFVVTHPDKMTDLQGNLVTADGEFVTSAPWGGELHNWRRSIDATRKMVHDAGFEVELVEELPFPQEMPPGLSPEESAAFSAAGEKYRRYPAIRLAVRARKSQA